MRSCVEVVADRRPDGSTVLTRLRASGQLAVRETGPGLVHLVGTAAGPLGGDETSIQVRVSAGARLSMRSIAAAVVLRGRDFAPSRLSLSAVVEEDGVLDLRLEPTVVARGGEHVALTILDLHASGWATVSERVVFGRHGEPSGRWVGRTVATVGGQPVLRHTLRSDVVRDDLGGKPVRALVTLLVLGGEAAGSGGVATSGLAVAMPLAAGGLLATTVGLDLASALRDLRAVTGPRHWPA